MTGVAQRTEVKARRVGVPLDPDLLVEALILERLTRLPKRRHPDWLRTLLVAGYLAERRRDQKLSESTTATPVLGRQHPAPRSAFAFTGASAFVSRPRQRQRRTI